jgi:hypothetical protein
MMRNTLAPRRRANLESTAAMTSNELRTVSQAELDDFRQDGAGNLYWRGAKIRTLMALPGPIDWAIKIGTAAAVILALLELLKFFGYGRDR